MHACSSKAVSEDSARKGIYWCALHSQTLVYCGICGCLPLCKVGEDITDHEWDGITKVPRHADCKEKATQAMETEHNMKILKDIKDKCSTWRKKMTMCEDECEVCTLYVETKEYIRAQAEDSVRMPKQAQMREAYHNASENELDIACERCDLPKTWNGVLMQYTCVENAAWNLMNRVMKGLPVVHVSNCVIQFAISRTLENYVCAAFICTQPSQRRM